MNIYLQTIHWNLILYKECLKNFFRELANYPTFFVRLIRFVAS